MRTIDVEELDFDTELGPGPTHLLDVREATEFEAGHVPGAVNLPLSDLAGWIDELDEGVEYAVICRSGNRSGQAVDALSAAGLSAMNLAGGMLRWEELGRAVERGRVLAPATEAHPAIRVHVVETPALGDRSYLVEDGEVAAVIDPQRDLDRMIDLASELGVRITQVAETHVHNDYVSGGPALASATGAAYLVNAADGIEAPHTPIHPDRLIAVGTSIELRPIATPGHTHTHLAYAVEVDGVARAVFTGGSLLYGSVGRPDLLGPDHTHELATAQHASAHHLADSLPAAAQVLPTHGFGSFCSASQATADRSTIGDEVVSNPALTQNLDDFLVELLEGLSDYPAYYAHMAPRNVAGATAPDLSMPKEANATALRRRIEAGEWVVDLRTRQAYAAGHAPGTLNFGLDGPMATYLGWLIDWGAPLTLLAESPEDLEEAQRELVRIGIDRPSAASLGGPHQWSDRPLASFPRAAFADLASVRRHRPVVVLDVRRHDEFDQRAISGAVNVPIHQLPHRLHDVPDGEVWVHCAGGYRASVAASLLDAAGRSVVAVDDAFDAETLIELGLVARDDA